jgi:hypothetical protein
VAQGKPVSDAVRAIAVSEATYFGGGRSWRAETRQVKRLKELERRMPGSKASGDLTLEKVVLKEPPREL